MPNSQDFVFPINWIGLNKSAKNWTQILICMVLEIMNNDFVYKHKKKFIMLLICTINFDQFN